MFKFFSRKQATHVARSLVIHDREGVLLRLARRQEPRQQPDARRGGPAEDDAPRERSGAQGLTVGHLQTAEEVSE